MNAIIFGSNGQDGYYLSKLLLDLDIKPYLISRYGSLNLFTESSLVLDISNFIQVSTIIKELQPDFIFHFAANSSTSHEHMFENSNTIGNGTLNILESVRCFSRNTKVFISGSGLQFKNEGLPIKETDPFEARDPYSVSRIHSVYAARYFMSLGLKVYIGFFYNHDSPRRTERHVSKKISEAAKRILAGSKEILSIGDVSVVKEWTFAGDIVEAIWTFVNQDAIHEINLGSGLGFTIREWIVECFGLVNLNWENHVQIEPDYKPQYKILVSDASKIYNLGWRPKVSFEELALMMMKN